MIRVKPEIKEEDQLEEIGYKIGSRANVCLRKLDEDLATIEEEQKVLDEDYEKVQRTSEGEMTGDQSLDIAEKFEGVLMRQIRLEQKKVSIYEQAYTEEFLLRMRAVDYLRRHEKIKFGSIRDITESKNDEKDPFMTIPGTPEELFTRDKTPQELLWYWRTDDDERFPRTPPYEIFRYRT
jgi:hypothetical protein